MALTPLQQLVDMKLEAYDREDPEEDNGLSAFLAYCRTVEMPTRDIAAEIQRRTGVVISHETARIWLNELKD